MKATRQPALAPYPDALQVTDGWTDLGECKWGAVRSPASVLAELEQKTVRYPNPRNATIGLRLFVHNRLKPPSAQRPLRVHHLDDLFE